MLNPIKYACVLLLAAPAIALADGVTKVTTRSTGSMTVDPILMEALGVFNVQGTGPLPYELTLVSNYDARDYMPERGTSAMYGLVDVTVDFRIGAYDYHYAGPQVSTLRLSTLGAGADGFEHTIDTSQTSGYFAMLSFQQTLSFPSGSVGVASLAPGHAAGAAMDPNGAAIITYSVPMAYNGSIYATMNGTVDTYSLDVAGPGAPGPVVTDPDVTSPVPEPATCAMLAAGLLTLGWRRRGRKASSSAA